MESDRQADCIVIGKQGDKYYLTIGENGGSVTTYVMNTAVYHAMILRTAEQNLSDARENIRLHDG